MHFKLCVCILIATWNREYWTLEICGFEPYAAWIALQCSIASGPEGNNNSHATISARPEPSTLAFHPEVQSVVLLINTPNTVKPYYFELSGEMKNSLK